MSIIIMGMEMPEHCGECKLKAAYDDETFCPFFTDNVEYWIAAGRRHEECPLGHVPPHGRLIDADALEHDFKKLVYQDNWYYNSLHHAPTIIPASEEGET